MVRVNVGEFIKENGASFYANMLQAEKVEFERAKEIRAKIAEKENLSKSLNNYTDEIVLELKRIEALSKASIILLVDSETTKRESQGIVGRISRQKLNTRRV